MTRDALWSKLAADPDPWARSGAASKGTGPALVTLAQDSSMIVRLSLVENPALPADLLSALTQDSDATVRLAAQARMS